MTDDVVRLPVIGRILRRRWRLLAALAVLGALLGAGASALFSPGYETTTRVLLQGPREPDELFTEAEVASSAQVLDRTAAALRWGVTGAELRESVTAEVVDGNVIEISGTADTPEKARQLADRVADEYVAFTTQLATDTAGTAAELRERQREAVRRQAEETYQRISELQQEMSSGLTVETVQVRTELESLRNALTEAVQTLDEVDAAAVRSGIIVFERAALPTSAAAPTLLHFVGGGALLFLLAGVLGHLIAARTDRRLATEDEIAAAVNAPVLANIDVPVPDEPAPEEPAARSWQARLRRFLLGTGPWNTPELPAPGDEHGRSVRYRRVLTRLPGRPVLVLVPDDDPAARQAAARLRETAVADPAGHRTPLHVLEVCLARPTVPDGDYAGMLVVITAGTRTGWELVSLVEAGADAGLRPLGVVVTFRARQDDDVPQAPPPENAATVAAGGDAMAGSP
ncbi:exopolysaccharide biosynthesis protein [Prauserella muralis]|uniref:Uncharacterized protein n=1 Tax=Prauserella muralis TaxID=588067 RepID=A0A2V4BN83_9PSEU|nr:exopolysaccharide biosynthesis protein [Prauserella muralis]PXY32093.1 hypothetical protein BAY60_07280 [Prauserella muralis]TWE13444.1 subunit length determinant protein [Prauserella muralis]